MGVPLISQMIDVLFRKWCVGSNGDESAEGYFRFRCPEARRFWLMMIPLKEGAKFLKTFRSINSGPECARNVKRKHPFTLLGGLQKGGY
jgi:hypothetical protein